MTVTVRHHHRAAAPGHRGDEQDGTALLQAAFVIPIFVLFLLGLVDLGLGVFQTSQATSAAADGARAGIVSYQQADVVGSPDQARILAAVRARAVGQSESTMTIGISCVTGSGGPVAGGCIEAGEDDRVKVTVSWPFRPISPMGKSLSGGRVKGTATMAIVQQPEDDLGPTTSTTTPTTTTSTTSTTAPTSTTTTTPNPCTVQVVTASPSTVSVNGAGKTSAAVAVTVTTNGSPACFGLTLTVDPGFVLVLSTTDTVTFTGTIPKGTDLGKNPGLRQGTFNLAPGPWPVVTVS